MKPVIARRRRPLSWSVNKAWRSVIGLAPNGRPNLSFNKTETIPIRGGADSPCFFQIKRGYPGSGRKDY
jgi:hypothetical protein